MTRYFFTLRCGSLVFPDRKGQILSNEADLPATALAQVVVRRPSSTALSFGCVVDVLDQNHNLIMQVPAPSVT